MTRSRNLGTLAPFLVALLLPVLAHSQELPDAHRREMQVPDAHSVPALEKRIELQDQLIAALKQRIRELESELAEAKQRP